MRGPMLLVGLGCAALAAACEGDGPSEYRLYTFSREPAGRPAPVDPPIVFIDGIQRDSLTVVYPDSKTLFATTHVVELRSDGRVARSLDASAALWSCGEPGEVDTYQLDVCTYASGDLRVLSTSSEGDEHCIGDVFCPPACRVGTSCGDDLRCTSRATSLDPLLSHPGCAPTGPRVEGEHCAWIADPAGAYDDCGTGLLCVDGACRRVCAEPVCPPECTQAPGHPPEALVCP